MNPAIIVLLIIGIALILFITEIIPLSCTAMLIAVSFQLTGVIEGSDTFKAFANQTTMIIASMAIIGEAVFRTGGAARIGDIITKFAKSERQVIFGTIILSSLMSGFLSNTGAAALLIAIISGMAATTGYRRSKLMYPIIVGCCLGGGISVVGTTSGMFVRESIEALGTGETLGFFEMAPLAILLTLIAAFYMAFIGYKQLPDNEEKDEEYLAEIRKAADEDPFKDIPKWKRNLSLIVLIAVFAGMVFEPIPLHLIAILGAMLVICSRCITAKEAYRAVPLAGIIIYAAMVPVSTAMINSGAADMIAGASQNILGGLNSPILIIAIIFLIINPITNCMSNAATIILFTPIAVIVAQSLGIDAKAMILAVRWAASIAIATPIGMPANSMVVQPGGYKFMDFVRPGLPMTLALVVVSITYISIVYPLYG
ncbi:MAG: SLC13 family permease [Lachnospiraceae bacterium]